MSCIIIHELDSNVYFIPPRTEKIHKNFICAAKGALLVRGVTHFFAQSGGINNEAKRIL